MCSLMGGEHSPASKINKLKAPHVKIHCHKSENGCLSELMKRWLLHTYDDHQ